MCDCWLLIVYALQVYGLMLVLLSVFVEVGGGGGCWRVCMHVCVHEVYVCLVCENL